MDLQQQTFPQEDNAMEPLAAPALPEESAVVDPISAQQNQAAQEAQAELEKQEDIRCKELLENMVKAAYDDERNSRESMVRRYKHINLIWTGNQYLVWDAGSGDYRTLDSLGQVLDELEIDPAMYNRPVNVFRAWGESIVGALTTSVPRTKFYPKSMSSADDISTARGFESISEVIDNHNNPYEKLAKIVTNLYKHGMCAAYNYVHEDDSYGKVSRDVYSSGQFVDKSVACPDCGAGGDVPIEEGIPYDPSKHGEKETQLTDLDALPEEVFECETHGQVPAQTSFSDPYNAPFVSGQEEATKRRVLIEIYDALNIIVPQNAATQKDVGFLICDVEIHEALARTLHPEIREKIKGSSSSSVPYDRWARASTEYGGDNATYLVTYRRTWFRPWYYNINTNDEDVALLKKRYPTGVRVITIDDNIAEAEEENIDKCWTISYNPLSNRIYDYSIGMGAAPIQEMFSEMVNLILLTIQYGVAETFADPEYFSFEKFKKIASSAGLVFPAKMPPDRPLSDAFVQLKPATLSRDAVDFLTRLEQYGQLITGAFPSIFGGNMAGGSGTYGEYETSKNQALQRLSLVWKMTTSLWHALKLKSCKMYRDAMIEDETFSKNVGESSIDVFIKRSELEGELGEVLAESTEAFPVSWSQQRDAAFKMIEQKFDPFLQILMLPENANFAQQILGLPNLYIPGSDDRAKQLKEIAIMLQGGPIDMGVDEVSGQPAPPQPSVSVDPTVDKHDVEAEVCSSFLRSDVGQYVKETNPQGYQNIVAHMQQHQMMAQQQAMMNQPPAGNAPPPPGNGAPEVQAPGGPNVPQGQ